MTYDVNEDVLSTERFGYDGWDPATPIPAGNENFNAWVDLDGSNNLTVRRVFGAGFDELVSRQDAGGTVQWYGTDQQGSVRQVFDNATGGVVNTIDFDAFGVILSGTPVDRYAYTGREWDADLGLQYSRGRMYDPAVGRFYSADPLGFAAGDANLYRYVGNSPTNSPKNGATNLAFLIVGRVVVECVVWSSRTHGSRTESGVRSGSGGVLSWRRRFRRNRFSATSRRV